MLGVLETCVSVLHEWMGEFDHQRMHMGIASASLAQVVVWLGR